MRNPSPFIQRMHAGGMMPIFFHPDEQVCLDLLYSAYEGGVRVIEMVNRGKEAKSIFPKIKEAAIAADLPTSVCAYTLRHSVTTELIRKGVPALTVAQLSGTSITMIERHYGHLVQGDAEKALAELVF